MNTQATSRDNGSAQGAAGYPHAVPSIDILEDEGGITLFADLPGVPRENLHVRVDGETLVIEAEAKVAAPQGLELVYGEAQFNSYRRQFTLSRELDVAHIDAELKNGVLRLVIPKSEQARPRRIEIRS